MCGVEMLQRVRVMRVFAASHMPAREAHTKLGPLRPDRQTFLATVRAGRYRANIAEMLTAVGHDCRRLHETELDPFFDALPFPLQNCLRQAYQQRIHELPWAGTHGVWPSLRIFAPIRIPEFHPLPLLDSHGSSKRQTYDDHKNFADGMCAQFSSRRGDCLSQDDESAIAPQRSAHDDFLGAIKAFVEATHGHEGAAGAEQEAAGGEARRPEQPGKDRHQQSCVQWDTFIELNRRPTPNGTATHGFYSSADNRIVHDRVGIHKDEQLTGCVLRAGIAGCGDLAMSDADDPSTVALGDEGRSIRRCIIDHNQLAGLIQTLRYGVQRIERCAEQSLLVVGRNNERDH
jgi:hypothetical protein